MLSPFLDATVLPSFPGPDPLRFAIRWDRILLWWKTDPSQYKLTLKKIDNATMAHVHVVGDNGTPAAILVWIYPTTGMAPSLREGSFSGTLAEGDITADKLLGPMKGGTVKELFEKIEYGTAGVAIHTKQNGGGELWGVHKEEKKGKTEKKTSSGTAPGY
jgi:hypothetical protein